MNGGRRDPSEFLRGRFDGVSRSEVLILGTGAAGLTAALGCAPRRVTVLTKARLGAGGSSPLAQGGVAVALGADDSPALHAADTMVAGAGLNDPEIVDLLTEEGPERMRALLDLGARFDRNAQGGLALGREAAHSRRRILHAKDATGAEIIRTLVEAVRHAPEIRVVEGAFAVDLVLDGGRVVGALAVEETGRRMLHLAPSVVLATGGLGQLYLRTTNPVEATGDGLAMAARAGARLVDLEFVQFHPTALAEKRPHPRPLSHLPPTPPPGEGREAPLPLLTEALRGEGAVLIDGKGRRFMLDEHPDAELAPRDVVARAIWRRLAAGDEVFLDARAAVGESFPERFPQVFQLCRERGVDPRVAPMPTAPAAHYHMGGVWVDADGRTSLPGLWACGEVTATGAHGANRLASNSLLEALVFGARVADSLRATPPASEPFRAANLRIAEGFDRDRSATGDAELTIAVRRLMWAKVGLVRDENGLIDALTELDRLAARYPNASGEARNLLSVARLVTAAALARQESRGGHFRSDLPVPDPAWERRLFLTAAPDGSALFEDATAQNELPVLIEARAR
jgi:L-aspartate oxidase